MNYTKLYEYYIVLFYKYNFKDIKFKTKYNLTEIYKYAYEFWQMNFDSKLDITKAKDKERLFNFLNDIFRYQTLNNGLRDLYKMITEDGKDTFVIDNIIEINDITNQVIKRVSLPEDDENYAKLSHEELDTYFREFLLSIDESGEYLDVYNQMINSRKVLYFDLVDDARKDKLRKKLGAHNDDNVSFILKNDEKADIYMVLDRKGDISDFRTLAHEFIHYYIDYYNHGKYSHYLLREFPSMFYEQLANKFLHTKGYNIQEVEKLLLYRFKEISDKSVYLSCINKYLRLFCENNFNIDHNIDTARIKEQIDNYIKENGLTEYEYELKRNDNLSNPSKMAIDYCDVANYYLLIDPFMLASNYPYLIGQYLTIYYLDEVDEKRVSLAEIKDITANLPNIDPSMILNLAKQKKYTK